MPKKIDAPDFLINICSISQHTSPSYNNLASRFNILYGEAVSKQAFWKKVKEPCVIFFQAILERLIKTKIDNTEIFIPNKTEGYKRILVQDSTIIKLPYHLFNHFSGVSNQHSTVCNARIQGVYDLISGCFVSFSIDSYSKNDQAAAPEIELQKGDLVLRDRGYYINNEIKRHIEHGADCIYRYKHKTTFLHPDTREPINLLKELKVKQKLDIQVRLNNPEKTIVRLVAFPVSEEVANQRRMKAKRDVRNQNFSEEWLKLMSWTIFVTTIPSDKADFNKLMSIYRLRWRIEIMFKIWKSHMKFAKLHNVSEIQLRVILLSRFIIIVVCINIIYSPYYIKVKEISGKYLSLIKLIDYLMLNSDLFLIFMSLTLLNKNNTNLVIYPFIKYCTYDKRKRLNYNQLYEHAFLS